MLPQEILSELTLDALLDMNEVKVKETLRRYGANAEECGRLQYALACLRKVTGLGGRTGLPSAEASPIGSLSLHLGLNTSLPSPGLSLFSGATDRGGASVAQSFWGSLERSVSGLT